MPYLGMTPEGDRTRLNLLSMALRIGSFGYFVHDVQTQTMTWAPDTYRIWGVDYAPGIPNPEWMLQTIHPDDRHLVLAWRADCSWVTKVVDFRIIRPDGEVRHLCTHMERSHLADGRVGVAYGILLDQTEHRQAATALEQSEARFKTLFESSGAGIVITSSRAAILFSNAAFAQLLGYTPTELLGK